TLRGAGPQLVGARSDPRSYRAASRTSYPGRSGGVRSGLYRRSVPRPRMVERRVSRFMQEPATIRNAVAVISSGTLIVVFAAAFAMRLIDRKEFHTFGT